MFAGLVQALARHVRQKLLGKRNPVTKRIGAAPGYDDDIGLFKSRPNCDVVARTDILRQALEILGLDLGELVDHNQSPDIGKLRQSLEKDDALHELDGLIGMFDAGVAGIHHDHAGGLVGRRRIFQHDIKPVAVPLAALFGKVSCDGNFWNVVETHFRSPIDESILRERG